MVIHPAERDLQHLVKAREGIASRDREQTGDCRVVSTVEADEEEVVLLGWSLRGYS